MNLLKLAGVVALFVVAAAWLRATWGVDLYAPLAQVATGAAGWLTRLAAWAQGKA